MELLANLLQSIPDVSLMVRTFGSIDRSAPTYFMMLYDAGNSSLGYSLTA